MNAGSGTGWKAIVTAPPLATRTCGVEANAPAKLNRLLTSVPGAIGPPAPFTPPANVPSVYCTGDAGGDAGKFTGARFRVNVPGFSPDRSSTPALAMVSLSVP